MSVMSQKSTLCKLILLTHCYILVNVMKFTLHNINIIYKKQNEKTMATIIRQATLTDINELIRWRMKSLRETFAGHKGISYSSLRQKNLNFYRRAMSMETYVACFADRGYTSVGYGGLCIYNETATPENPSGCCAYIMNVYTGPSVREQGIAAQIVEWLVEEAHRRGITKVYTGGKPEPTHCCFSEDFSKVAEA